LASKSAPARSAGTTNVQSRGGSQKLIGRKRAQKAQIEEEYQFNRSTRRQRRKELCSLSYLLFKVFARQKPVFASAVVKAALPAALHDAGAMSGGAWSIAGFGVGAAAFCRHYRHWAFQALDVF
jgi:hypothetical protein